MVEGIDLEPPACALGKVPMHRSYAPLYFVAPAMMVALAGFALIRHRLGGEIAMLLLPCALAALGGPLRELRTHHDLAYGAAILAASGAIALAVAVADAPEHPRGARRRALTNSIHPRGPA